MNSLETLKKELIKQKQILDGKGYPVTVVNTNPSPSEITSAIEKIEFDFSLTTATEEDVKMGKTFYSQTNEIKTGTFDMTVLDDYKAKIACFVGGYGSMEIEIPTNISSIQRYAYYTPPNTKREGLYYKENLTFPENITHLEGYCFAYSNVSGLLIIPTTCAEIESFAFRNTSITEVIVNNGLIGGNSNNASVFENCVKLQKATINQQTSQLPSRLFAGCSALQEVILPSTLKDIAADVFSSCSSLKYVKFNSIVPPTITTTFQFAKNAYFLVPYEYFDAYFNATNYQRYSNTIVGYGDFGVGATLPSELNGFSLVWYSNLDDLESSTNPITTVSQAGTMYSLGTEITTE